MGCYDSDGNNYQKILLPVWIVKGKIPFENGRDFQAQIDELCLKFGILPAELSE